MPSLYVTPALQEDGTPFLVRQPHKSYLPLPVEGAWVPDNEYWRRRIRDRDAIEAEPPREDDGAGDPQAEARRKR